MCIRRLSIATNKKQRESILEMMTDYFINDMTDEGSIIEQAEYILHEDFSRTWRKAGKLAKKLVEELWFEAEFNAQAANEEARGWYEARESSLADARSGAW